jgi:feruloyl esterase
MKITAVIIATALVVFSSTAFAAVPCESLKTLVLPNTTITLAERVGPGQFTAPGGRGGNYANLPAFCRVAATLKPSSDSDIKIEVWMPEAG